MNYAETYALKRSNSFRDKVGTALIKTAKKNIDAEPTVPPDPLAPQKSAWSRSVLYGNCDRWIDIVICRVIGSNKIAAAGDAALDADVQNMIDDVLPELISIELR